MKSRLAQGWLKAASFVALLVVGGSAYLAQLPDHEVTFARAIPAEREPPADWDQLGRWPAWYFSLRKVEPLEPVQPPRSPLAAGTRLRMWMEPKGKEWKRFELIAEVTEHRPGRKVGLRLEKDSTGRLTRMFSNFEWTAELAPTEIKGELRAMTNNWRSRWLTYLTPRTLLNQVYYPDLEKLAGRAPSEGVELYPAR